MILRARVVLPITGPPIRDGAVSISGKHIETVLPWSALRSAQKRATLDLGSVILMPGLVNAHCHLDYTHMAGQIPPPKRFTDWLRLIVSIKAGWSLAEYAASWKEGAHMLLRSGTTTVADIEAMPGLLPEIWQATPLRVISFLEMIGITSRRPPEVVLQEALAKRHSLGRHRAQVGLSPHAPYSTVPELLGLSARAARTQRLLLSTHVAESALEYAMFTRGDGEMFEWLQRSGRDMSDCGLGTPVRHLHRTGILDKNLLVIHANYLGRRDTTLLARNGVSVVHCPRSHSYFRHQPFPLKRLARAGVNLCLGTDSLATVRKPGLPKRIELDMFAEMRSLAEHEPTLPPRMIVRMATVNSARALRFEGQLGALSRRALADLILIPLPDKATDPYEAVVRHEGPVSGSMIEGKWAWPPNPR